MIKLNDLNGQEFIINCDLIETINSIPESKISLTTGKYFLVQNTPDEIIKSITAYYQEIYGSQKKIVFENRTVKEEI